MIVMIMLMIIKMLNFCERFSCVHLFVTAQIRSQVIPNQEENILARCFVHKTTSIFIALATSCKIAALLISKYYQIAQLDICKITHIFSLAWHPLAVDIYTIAQLNICIFASLNICKVASLRILIFVELSYLHICRFAHLYICMIINMNIFLFHLQGWSIGEML